MSGMRSRSAALPPSPRPRSAGDRCFGGAAGAAPEAVAPSLAAGAASDGLSPVLGGISAGVDGLCGSIARAASRGRCSGSARGSGNACAGASGGEGAGEGRGGGSGGARSSTQGEQRRVQQQRSGAAPGEPEIHGPRRTTGARWTPVSGHIPPPKVHPSGHRGDAAPAGNARDRVRMTRRGSLTGQARGLTRGSLPRRRELDAHALALAGDAQNAHGLALRAPDEEDPVRPRVDVHVPQRSAPEGRTVEHDGRVR
jgi:hypothetical protein